MGMDKKVPMGMDKKVPMGMDKKARFLTNTRAQAKAQAGTPNRG